MRRVLLVFGVLISLCNYAQDSTRRTAAPAPKSFLSTIPARSILSDYNIGYAHSISSKYTLEYRIGWVHRNNILHEYYEGWFTSTDCRFHGPSFYLQLNKWNYMKSMRRYYWGIITGYRYTWYYEKSLWLGGNSGSSFEERPVLSQWRNGIYVLGTLGIQTTRVSTFEISVGIRVMQTYTHVSDTRFHPQYMTPEEYDEYRVSLITEIPYAMGWGIQPVFRISSRLGLFEW